MPLKHSIFRIIHRTAQDPHGVEGYFIHELYVNPDYTLRSWRAGVTIGAPGITVLKEHMIRVIDAFRYEIIEHRDLKTGLAISHTPVDSLFLPGDLKKLEESRGEIPRAISEDLPELPSEDL